MQSFYIMIILSILCLLFSNAVTMIRDMSILFNRIAIIALVYCFLHDLVSLSIINKGIGLHGGLLHVTNTTQIFHIFVFIVSMLILQLTSFFPAVQYGVLQSWVQLSNSGELLKIMIPSVIQKVNSGWGNYSGKVTSHNMSGNEMDNRGYKSIVYKSIVKEQRIDGSLRIINLERMRFILKGFERNYQIRIPFNQINMNKCYSSATLQCASTSNNFNINPWFITGFTSGEGCFYVKIVKSKTKLGEAVYLTFQLTQHLREESLIISIASYLDCGKIYKNRESIYLDITKFSDLTGKVLPILEKHPIMGKKLLDFEDFCKVAELMQNKAHLTQLGLEAIREIKTGMNIGRK